MSISLALHQGIFRPTHGSTSRVAVLVLAVYPRYRIELQHSLCHLWKWVLLRRGLDWDQMGAGLIPLPKIRLSSVARMVLTIGVICLVFTNGIYQVADRYSLLVTTVLVFE